MSQLVITSFSDPMMGLAYEYEPVMRKLETHYPSARFRNVMCVLVRDFRDWAYPYESVEDYNRRLAKIYESEEAVGGVPIRMPNLQLFAEDRRSSRPLCLAYKAAQIVAPETADLFLYQLRYATVAETRPTTRVEEIYRVARMTGVDEERLRISMQDGSAAAALARDLAFAQRLGVRGLPTYMAQFGTKRVLVGQLRDYSSVSRVIQMVSEGAVVESQPERTQEAVAAFVRRRRLLSQSELQEAFDFKTAEQALEFVDGMPNVALLPSRKENYYFIQWEERHA